MNILSKKESPLKQDSPSAFSLLRKGITGLVFSTIIHTTATAESARAILKRTPVEAINTLSDANIQSIFLDAWNDKELMRDHPHFFENYNILLRAVKKDPASFSFFSKSISENHEILKCLYREIPGIHAFIDEKTRQEILALSVEKIPVESTTLSDGKSLIELYKMKVVNILAKPQKQAPLVFMIQMNQPHMSQMKTFVSDYEVLVNGGVDREATIIVEKQELQEDGTFAAKISVKLFDDIIQPGSQVVIALRGVGRSIDDGYIRIYPQGETNNANVFTNPD